MKAPARSELPFFLPSDLRWPTMHRLNTGDRRRLDGCDARVHWHRPFGWCNRLGAYTRGDQVLCELHAGMVSAGVLPVGITPSGKWMRRTETLRVKAGIL